MRIRYNKAAFTLLLTIVVALTFVISIKIVEVNAGRTDTSSMKREYISVEIQPGDTLLSIAKEYMGVGYSDVDDYVKDIKDVNGLTSNTIHAGNNIIIPHYVTVEK